MNIKVLTQEIRDASGKTVGVEPSVEIALESGESYDDDMLKQLRDDWTGVLRKRVKEALDQGRSPDSANGTA